MRTDRISAWTLALVVAAAAVAKIVRLDATERDLAALLTAAGTGSPSALALRAGIVAIAVLEVALAVVIATPRRPRAGLAALVVLMSAGVVMTGAATSWGRNAELACPCGLPVDLPFLRNKFAALLFRDALLLALVLLAWGPRSSRGESARSVAGSGRGAAGPA